MVAAVLLPHVVASGLFTSGVSHDHKYNAAPNLESRGSESFFILIIFCIITDAHK